MGVARFARTRLLHTMRPTSTAPSKSHGPERVHPNATPTGRVLIGWAGLLTSTRARPTAHRPQELADARPRRAGRQPAPRRYRPARVELLTATSGFPTTTTWLLARTLRSATHTARWLRPTRDLMMRTTQMTASTVHSTISPKKSRSAPDQQGGWEPGEFTSPSSDPLAASSAP